MSEWIDQIDRYLDGELPQAQAAELRHWINADPANARTFAKRAALHHEIRSVLHRNRVQTVQDPENILQELLAHEAEAHAELVNILPPLQNTPTKQDWANAGRYVLEHSLTTRSVAVAALAAALLLGVVLTIVLLSGPDSGDEIAQQPWFDDDSTQPDTPIHLPVVATLTATHNAQWGNTPAERTLARGSELKAGQTLTLTAGFAEITTSRGAIAILEAPATVELIDNANGLRLHAGKIVGICETEFSKGFLVRTPHIDVVDLGTEFGVSVSETKIDLSVFVGEIEVVTDTLESTRLESNQGASVSISDLSAELIVHDDPIPSFTRRLPRPALVEAVRFNVDGLQANVEPQSFFADALLYADRDYRLSIDTEADLPAVLLGADIVQMPIGAFVQASKLNDAIEVSLTVSQPADVYLLLPPMAACGDWLARDYKRTDMSLGFLSLGAGPRAAPQSFEIWQRREPITGTSVVAGSLNKGSYGMYTIAVQPVKQQPENRTPDPIN